MVDSENFGVTTIITIVVATMLVASLLPPAISAATSADFDDRETTVVLTEGESYNLSDTNAQMTLNGVNASVSPSTASYSLAANGDSTMAEINEGSSMNVTVDSIQYNIEVTQVDGPNNVATAIVTYEISNGGGAAASVWILIPIFIVLTPLLLFVTIALDNKDGI